MADGRGLTSMADGRGRTSMAECRAGTDGRRWTDWQFFRLCAWEVSDEFYGWQRGFGLVVDCGWQHCFLISRNFLARARGSGGGDFLSSFDIGVSIVRMLKVSNMYRYVALHLNNSCNLFWFEIRGLGHTEALYQYLGSKQTYDGQGRSRIRKIYARWS